MSKPSEQPKEKKQTKKSSSHTKAHQEEKSTAKDAAGNNEVANKPSATPKKKSWLKRILYAFLILFVLLALLLAAFWVWSGRDGSLAQAISLAQRYIPIVQQSLQVENVQGSVRRGGSISFIHWKQDNIDAKITDLDLSLDLNALFYRKAHIKHLRADVVQLNILPSEEKPETPPSTPPQNVGIPFITAYLDEFKVNTFIYGDPSASKENANEKNITEKIDAVTDAIVVQAENNLATQPETIVVKADATDVKREEPAPATTTQSEAENTVEESVKNESAEKETTTTPPASGLVFYIRNIQANYHFDRKQHEFNLNSLEFENGQFKAKVILTARNPELTANLTAALITDIVESSQQANANAVIDITGLLTELNIVASAQVHLSDAPPLTPNQADKSTPNKVATTPVATETPAAQTANLTATVTPWGTMIVPVADLNMQNFNIGALWSTIPQTSLSGEAHLKGTERAQSAIGSLDIQVNIKNALPGPLDKNHIPISSISTHALWNGDQIKVEEFNVLVGSKGSLGLDSLIQLSENAPINELPLTNINLSINHVNPYEVYSSLENDEINGHLRVNNKPDGLFYDLALTGLNTYAKNARKPKLQNVILKGSVVDKNIQAQELDIKSSNSNLKGDANFQLPINLLRAIATGEEVDIAQTFQKGVADAQISLHMPGIDAKADAKNFSENAGKLLLDVKAPNIKTAILWLQQMPFIADIAKEFSAQGGMTLKANVENGWLNPKVDAQFLAPELVISQMQKVEASSESDSNTGSYAFKELVNIKHTDITLNGRLTDATIKLKTTANIEQKSLSLDMQAQGGMKNDLINVKINQLDTAFSQQEKTVVAIHIDKPVELSWNQTDQHLILSPGSLKLKLAGKDDQAPSISWEKSSWRAGVLDTTGKINAFPALWLTTLLGTEIAGLNLGGNLTVGGSWRIHMGSNLDFFVEIARIDGDITLESTGRAFASTNISDRMNAGIKEAYIRAYNKGNKIHLDLVWDTARASVIHVNVATLFSKVNETWTITPDAPLSGTITAQLPEIGIAAALAPTGWRFGGAVILDTELHGTVSAPTLKGRLHAMGVSMRSIIEGIAFENGKLDIAFDKDLVQLENLYLQGFGKDGGNLSATGLVDWRGNKDIPTITLDMKFDKLKASVHRERQVTTSGNINLSLKDKDLNITGDILVDKALIIIGGNDAPQLDSDVVVLTGDESIDNPKKGTEPNAFQKLGIVPKINLRLDMGKNLRVQGFGLQTYLTGKLVVGNQGWTPTLFGTINTVDGRFKAYGQHLVVESGTIIFNGVYDNPTLNILAIRANTSEKVGISITGTVSHPAVKPYSASGLSDTETLSWLILGRSASSSDGAEMALIQQVAMTMISGEGGGITDKLAGAIGVDEISLGGSSNSTASSSDDGLANTTITIGKRISEKFYVSYEQSLTGAMGTFYTFYDVSRRLTLRGEIGEFTAVDLIYTFKFDGKKNKSKPSETSKP